MGVFSLLWFLLIGLIAGWLAGLLTKGRGLGLANDLIVGVLGAFLGRVTILAHRTERHGLDWQSDHGHSRRGPGVVSDPQIRAKVLNNHESI